MAKQTFTTGQVLTASQMTSLQQTAMGGGSATTKTASYVLVAADAGTTVTMTSASATTITVNTALFAAGDTVYIQNLGAGISTITAGTATVNTSASLALAQYEGGQLYFNSTSAAIFIKGAGAAAASGAMTLLQSLALSGSSVTSSTLSSSYKQFFIYIKAAYASGAAQVRLRLNGDSGSNYSYVLLENGSADLQASMTELRFANMGSATTAKLSNNYFITIMNPADTDQVFVQSIGQIDQTGLRQYVTTGVYDSSAAITSITFNLNSNTFSAGTAYIYGVN